MASTKRHGSILSRPPSYHEYRDIEMGRVPRSYDGIKSNSTGSTMRAGGGYHDYEPNAPHDPRNIVDCNDQLVHRKQAQRKAVSMAVWQLHLLYGLLLLLLVLLGVGVGLLATHTWPKARTDLFINGVHVNDTTLWLQSAAPSVATVTTTENETLSETETLLQTVTYTPPPPQTVKETVTYTPPPPQTVIETMIYTPPPPPPTITTKVFETFTAPGPTETVINTQTVHQQTTLTVQARSTSAVSDNDTDTGHVAVAVVTPPRSIVTSVLLLTTTMPTKSVSQPPPVTVTTVVPP